MLLDIDIAKNIAAVFNYDSVSESGFFLMI